MRPRWSGQAGFSLIELAIVLVIVGLLLGGGIVALEVSTERQQRAEQRGEMREIREALYGYAVSRGHLPCADTSNPPDGVENRANDSCDSDADQGALPWSTLGIGRRDAWGHFLYYAVDLEYARRPDSVDGSAFDFGSEPSLRVESSVTDLDAVTLASEVPAVVVSFGGQGGQVWTDGGFNCPTGEGFSEDEAENCNGSSTFVAGDYRDAQSDMGRFDDIVIWIVDPVLKSRMVDAGRLP